MAAETADLVGFFVLLRTVTLLYKEVTRLELANVEALLESV